MNNYKNFPEQKLINDVLSFQRQIDDYISPDFLMIDNGDEWSLKWFDGDKNEASNFLVFAMTTSSSLFGFWAYDNVKNPPVVFLSNECQGSKVIANSFSEFLSLVSFASDDYWLDIDYVKDDEEWEGPEEIGSNLLQLREWLQTTQAISKSNSPLHSIKTAMSEHPDLMTHIEKWQLKTQ